MRVHEEILHVARQFLCRPLVQPARENELNTDQDRSLWMFLPLDLEAEDVKEVEELNVTFSIVRNAIRWLLMLR